MPDIGREGELREGLPQRTREEAVGRSAIALHAGEDHPAQSQWPSISGQAVVQSVGEYGQLGSIELLVRMHGEHASDHRCQTYQPADPDPEGIQLVGSATRSMQKVPEDGTYQPGLTMQVGCQVEPIMRILRG